MYKYIVTRLLLMIPTLIGAGILVFLLMRLVPGDICLIKMGETAAPTEEELALTYPPGYRGDPEAEGDRRPGTDT